MGLPQKPTKKRNLPSIVRWLDVYITDTNAHIDLGAKTEAKATTKTEPLKNALSLLFPMFPLWLVAYQINESQPLFIF